MMYIPKLNNKVRWLIIIYAIFVFIWSGRENTNIHITTLISFGITALMITVWTVNRLGGKRISVRTGATTSILIGAIIGFGTSVTTSIMMMFINIRHGHTRPDYPLELVGAMLQRGPLWMVAGILAGLAFVLLWLAVQPSPDSEQQSFMEQPIGKNQQRE